MATSLTFGPVISKNGTSTISWISMVSKPPSERRIKPRILNVSNSTDRSTFSSKETRVLYRRYTNPNPDYETWGVLYTGREWSLNHSFPHTKIAASIKDSKANLALLAAEYKKAVDLFLGLSKTLYEGWSRFRRIRRFRGYSRYGDLSIYSKRWLEFQFGLRPIASDLKGICDSLGNNIREGIYLYFRVRDTALLERDRTYPDPQGSSRLFHYEKHISRQKAFGYYRVRDPNLRYLGSMQLLNAPALIWELIPYSFLVDYMFDIGDFLNTLGWSLGIDDIKYIITTKETFDGQTTDLRSGATATVSTVTYRRTRTQDTVNVGYPRFQFSDSSTRLVNCLALLGKMKVPP